jgi:hypothetical protein
MIPAGFEAEIAANEEQQTYSLDHVATGIGVARFIYSHKGTQSAKHQDTFHSRNSTTSD